MSHQPLTLAGLEAHHREILVPDLQRLLDDHVAGLETRLVGQIERLWDALLGTRERLETEYVLTRSGIARVEELLDRMGAQQRDLVAAALRLDERLSRVERHLEQSKEPPPG